MDASTIYIISALMMTLNGAALGLIHRGLPDDIQPSAADWRTGTLLIAVGTLLLAFQRYLPSPFALTVGNGCLAVALVLYARSLRKFHKLPDMLWLWGAPALCVIGIFVFAYLSESLSGRVIVASLTLMPLLAVSISALLRGNLQFGAPSLHSARVLLWLFIALFVLLALRGIYFTFWTVSVRTTLDINNTVNLIAAMLITTFPVIGTTAFALMCLERMQRQWKTAASIDHLTGLVNRMTLNSASEWRFNQPRAKGQSFALLIIDVDNFKSINDNFGHATGDLALVHVAKILQLNFPAPHMIGRQGGEEFLALLEVANEAQAHTLAEQARRSLANSPLALQGANELRITVSIGVAIEQPSDAKVDELLRRGDRALYAAKSAGRNLVVLAQA
jgi:diguanylate cyclase (GGDEF)-like protein